MKGTKHFELLKKEKVQLLLFLFFLAEIQISFSQSIQFLGNLTFPHDLSTQWIGGSSLATVGGSIQLWFSQSTLYIIKPNPLDKKHALTFVYNASIPEVIFFEINLSIFKFISYRFINQWLAFFLPLGLMEKILSF